VKGVVAIFLLSLYLFGTTEAYQALKMPMLVAHYIKHKHEDPHLTLLGFLRLHYSGKTVFDSDYAQDMKLPFKTQENTALFSAINDIPQPIGIKVESPLLSSLDYVIRDTQFEFPAFPHTVFQPPRA